MDQLGALCSDLATRVGFPILLEKENVSEKPRSQFVADAARRYANELKAPRWIDKRSFLESELMFAVASYFADDYRLYLDCLQGREAGNARAAWPRSYAA